MDERQLAAIIEQEIATSIGSQTGDLSSERELELSYYNSAPFGNEKEGESQVVSSDVFDTVEGMLPSLLRIFSASDDVVMFEAEGPEDEEKAKQRTDVCNYIFYRQNNGFLVLYEWFKDALINKNGVVKYWWDENITTVKESYEGLSEGQYLKLKQDKDVEILAMTARYEYPDEDEIAQRQTGLENAMKMADQRGQGMPPGAIDQLKAQIQQQAAAMPDPMVYDIEIRIKKDKSKVCIEVVPPEEFFITSRQRCISIQDTEFCCHKRQMTVSDLMAMGCPEEILSKVGSTGERDFSVEALQRDRFTDELRNTTASEMSDPSRRQVWVSDCYIKIDFDEDGISERRHIIMVDREIWINEECDHIGFAALTPIIMPHRWLGKSAAELVMADQFTKSTIWRQMLNNLYLTNNPTKTVLSTPSGVAQANLDDLMTSRPGGIRREYVPNAIRNDEVPFVAGASFPMLEYIDSQKEVRTGQTRYSQGTDADSLNKTARGIQMIQQAGQQRGDLIARIFAETGVKDLMRGIAYMISKYSTKSMTLKLRNKWVEVDPREWEEQFNMTVNVGLGTGNKDIQLAHLERMGVRQAELLQMGKGYMVTDENIYNLDSKRAEAMGFKHPELFISDPKTIQKPQLPPPPEIVKIQTDAQIDQAKIQSNEKQRMLDAQIQKSLAELNSQTQMQIAKMNNDAKVQIEQMNIQAKAQSDIFNANKDVGIKQLDHSHEMNVADRTTMETAKEKADEVVSEREVNIIAHTAQAQEQTMQIVGTIGQELVQVIAQFGQMIGGIQQTLTAQTMLQQRELEKKEQPRMVNISGIKKDDNGMITGATIN
tara:strand:+ start:816 stop:3293 length:2478 start_codon:yes stop_codon:yes gene_type:complete